MKKIGIIVIWLLLLMFSFAYADEYESIIGRTAEFVAISDPNKLPYCLIGEDHKKVTMEIWNNEIAGHRGTITANSHNFARIELQNTKRNLVFSEGILALGNEADSFGIKKTSLASDYEAKMFLKKDWFYKYLIQYWNEDKYRISQAYTTSLETQINYPYKQVFRAAYDIFDFLNIPVEQIERKDNSRKIISKLFAIDQAWLVENLFIVDYREQFKCSISTEQISNYSADLFLDAFFKEKNGFSPTFPTRIPGKYTFSEVENYFEYILADILIRLNNPEKWEDIILGVD